MSKIKVVIPAKINSIRVPKKNIKLLGGKPLVSYMIETCKKVFPSKDIYVYSNSDILKEIANRYEIQFLKESDELASPDTLIDDAIYDVLCRLECDYLIQANPTAPFVSNKQLQEFSDILVSDEYDVLNSVKEIQIECTYRGKPINFNPHSKMISSANLIPVYADVAALYGFKTSICKYNYEKYGYFIYGRKKDKTNSYILDGYSSIDIDTEEDFRLAEHIMNYA